MNNDDPTVNLKLFQIINKKESTYYEKYNIDFCGLGHSTSKRRYKRKSSTFKTLKVNPDTSKPQFKKDIPYSRYKFY